MYKQLYEHFNWILLPKQCEFQKSDSAQQCLMVVLGKIKKFKNKG